MTSAKILIVFINECEVKPEFMARSNSLPLAYVTDDMYGVLKSF